MAHTFEVGFAESGIYGRRQVDILGNEERMIASFIAAAEVAVSRIIVVQEGRFTAQGTRGMFAIFGLISPSFSGR